MSSLPPSSPAPSPPSSPSKTPARSWREFFDTKTLSFPTSVSETLTRLETNLPYFRVNYSILYFMIFPLQAFVHHFSIVTLVPTTLVFLIVFYRYFTASPIDQAFGYTVDDQSISRIIFFAGIFCMLIFHSGSTVLVFILVYLVMIFLHGALKAVPDAGENPYDRLLDHHTTGPTYNTMVSSL